MVKQITWNHLKNWINEGETLHARSKETKTYLYSSIGKIAKVNINTKGLGAGLSYESYIYDKRDSLLEIQTWYLEDSAFRLYSTDSIHHSCGWEVRKYYSMLDSGKLTRIDSMLFDPDGNILVRSSSRTDNSSIYRTEYEYNSGGKVCRKKETSTGHFYPYLYTRTEGTFTTYVYNPEGDLIEENHYDLHGKNIYRREMRIVYWK